jgi:DNA-binding NarL/FixJ family response regulator
MPMEHELERAREYVLTGHYGRAIELLADCEDWEAPFNERALLLRAEIAVRRDPVAALELLARIHDLFVTTEGRFGYYLASGKAYAHSRNPGAAGDMYAAAAAIVADGYEAGAAELSYQLARLQWLNHEYQPESPDLARAIAAEDPGLRCQALAVRAWMYAGLGRYGAQLADLVAAIDVADEHLARCDVRAVGRILHALFRSALELGDVAATAAGERVYDRIAWTDDTREEQFLVVRALAWNAFLCGESAKAQWLFRDSKEVAPSDAWKVMAHVDRSFVARFNGNDAWSADELFEAHALARTVVWSETRGEERQALSMLAILFAPVDMAQAQHYVSTYIRLGFDNIDASLGITQDRRADAFSLYASGRVQQMLGNGASAKRTLEAAYEIFIDAGYDFRAALVAEALADLTQDREWTTRAREHAARFPQSALPGYLASPVAERDGPGAGLSPLHRKLAAALCEGLDAAQLSRRFSRSEFTIRREIQSLYDGLDVRNLSELRRRFAQIPA